ncbi:hypothetical protein PGT21_023562 [Puccinia graminis f. sp. tritici]|uniref:Uncharacterized protein n=1 Tax=Puccinia graminis f. sp. tritici TaxID=56615 RepID=A0A5B0NWN2_PUCGR|nr:hypothetical protein PGT21_023004 [Puccinia graminis f. sp. tritici]KAA1093066.1 hypothetical protein PGT21_023562 [Puccinia graminis f. sp. tritici]
MQLTTLDNIAKQLKFVENNIANWSFCSTAEVDSTPLATGFPHHYILQVLNERDPGALIPPQVRQQLQDKVRPEAGVNPNTLNEINQQLATIIWAEQTQQEATRHMDNLQDGPWTTEAQHNYPYNMQNQR